jgi:hypothetical protein
MQDDKAAAAQSTLSLGPSSLLHQFAALSTLTEQASSVHDSKGEHENDEHDATSQAEHMEFEHMGSEHMDTQREQPQLDTETADSSQHADTRHKNDTGEVPSPTEPEAVQRKRGRPPKKKKKPGKSKQASSATTQPESQQASSAQKIGETANAATMVKSGMAATATTEATEAAETTKTATAPRPRIRLVDSPKHRAPQPTSPGHTSSPSMADPRARPRLVIDSSSPVKRHLPIPVEDISSPDASLPPSPVPDHESLVPLETQLYGPKPWKDQQALLAQFANRMGQVLADTKMDVSPGVEERVRLPLGPTSAITVLLKTNGDLVLCRLFTQEHCAEWLLQRLERQGQAASTRPRRHQSALKQKRTADSDDNDDEDDGNDDDGNNDDGDDDKDSNEVNDSSNGSNGSNGSDTHDHAFVPEASNDELVARPLAGVYTLAGLAAVERDQVQCVCHVDVQQEPMLIKLLEPAKVQIAQELLDHVAKVWAMAVLS